MVIVRFYIRTSVQSFLIKGCPNAISYFATIFWAIYGKSNPAARLTDMD